MTDNGGMLTCIRASAPPLLHALQSGLSKLPVELIWTAHPQWPLPGPTAAAAVSNRPLRISILDSSFNPPTLAHLALANSERPKYSTEPPETKYDAKLLLLSVKNADKTLQPGDASYLQRLEMMALLAQDVHAPGQGRHNVAIAIVGEPTFVGKSSVLQEYLQNRLCSLLPTPESSEQSSSSTPRTQLSFIIGMDTLERLFSPRYYIPSVNFPTATAEQTMMSALSRMLSPDSGHGDDSLIVCAKRGGQSPTTVTLAPKMSCIHTNSSSSPSADIPKDERIVLIDIGDRASKFSSTAVRNARGRIGLGLSDSGGGPWREWVTKRVAQHIEEQNLYVT